jgi:Bacterial regulatory proteins, luxR family
MTMGAAAAELFLSQKTVETHLRNIFNKMDVADRVALAGAVERRNRTANAPLVVSSAVLRADRTPARHGVSALAGDTCRQRVATPVDAEGLVVRGLAASSSWRSSSR